MSTEAPTRAEVAHLDDDEAQDKLLELAMAAGFKYDGQSLWSATLYGHELLRFMSEVQARERERWEAALRMTWRGIDPLHPAGQPGSYARGSHNGYAGALETLRENLKIATKDQ